MLGIDLGATKVVAGLVSPEGKVTAEADRRVHRNDGPRGVLATLLEVAQGLAQEGRRVDAVGVAVAAQVDSESGRVLYAPNLRWRDVPLGAWLARRLAVPVLLENDVRSATWGEWRHGGHEGIGNLACLYVGTGVGGGFVVDGRLLGGACQAAGEVGHLTVVAEGRKCSCPNRGCLEAYVGGWAIGARAREEARAHPREAAAMLERAGGLRQLDATVVTALARERDPAAHRLMEETGTWLAAGAVSIVNAFNPERLLLGGGVLEGYPDLARSVARAVARRAQPPAAAAVRVGRVRLGAWGPVIGAASRVRDRLEARGPHGGAPRARGRSRR